MSKRLLILAVLVLVSLAAYVYFFEIRGREAREAREQEALRLLPGLALESVDWISVEPAGAPAVRVSRVPGSEGEWRIESPLVTEADPEAVEGLVRSILDLKREGEPFTFENEGPAAFGLDPPALAVAVGSETGGELGRLLVGGSSPVGGNRYVAVEGTPEVCLVATYSADALQRSLSDLREKRLLRFDRDEVTALEIEADGFPRVRIEREGTDWVVLEPYSAEASGEKVGDLIWDLANCRAERFAAERADDLSAFGLDEPVCRVRVFIGEERASLTALFGKDAAGAEAGGDGTGAGAPVFAASTARDPVLVVPRTVVDAAARVPGEWREDRIFPLSSWEVRGLEVAVRGAAPLRLREEDDGAWRVAGGDWSGEEADAVAVSDYLYNITDLRACAFLAYSNPALAAHGLEDPEMTIPLYPSGRDDGEGPDTALFDGGTSGGTNGEGDGKPEEWWSGLGNPLVCAFSFPGRPESSGEGLTTPAAAGPADAGSEQTGYDTLAGCGGDAELFYGIRPGTDTVFVIEGDGPDRLKLDEKKLFGGEAEDRSVGTKPF